MRPGPQFFIMGAACPVEGDLKALDYDTHPGINMRQLRTAFAAGLKEVEETKAKTVMVDFGAKYYSKPKVSTGGKAKVWPSIIGPYSSSSPVIVHQDVPRH